ncbi:general transcription factor 3C polypeptide 5-like [Varroa jacobsoni]|uniref:general transcription factor 3C polypeptide 5-like n=1 Tax=Varroa jacobsoni TaxID=62625 RepID=UPI000BF7152A|nr:general transcription factor 3C polypeptide 5-like [Varroa jacobsoni]XP_022711692.1 general transcription factor 3C polypeptide 5-like [Varroa jacobsoni]
MEPGPSYATEVGSVSDPKQEQILSNLVLIKHPCLVRDGSEKRAIAMLGGIAQVEHTFNVGNMRMQLNFRTEGDSCSKGIFGTHRDIIGIWAVVRRYRNRRTGQVICHSEPLGVVRHVYEFDGMADFQYLPAILVSQRAVLSKEGTSATMSAKSELSLGLVRKEKVDSSSNTQAIALEKPKDNLRELPDLSSSGNNETQTSSNEGSTRPFVSERKHITDMGNGIGRDIRNELVEINITGLEFDSFVKSNSVPLFIVPQVFTRMDLPYTGVYRHVTGTRLHRKDEAGLPVLRKQRTNYATIVRLLAPPFGDKVPQQALPEAIELFELVDEHLRARVAEAFQRRPVWTKSALSHELDIDRVHLKTVIVGLAYCVNQGPFRLCWVRYGFDPRTDPSAKPFQTLDCRVKVSTNVRSERTVHFTAEADPTTAQGGSSWDAPAVRGGHVVPVQIAPSGYRHKRHRKEDIDAREVRERNTRMLRCKYIPGRLPHSRQLLYHLCDIGLNSVQELVHRNDGQEVWSDQDGWCLSGTTRHIRDYLAADMKQTVERQRAEKSQDEDDDALFALEDSQKASCSLEHGEYGNEGEDFQEEMEDDDDMEGFFETS